ncbi:MAG: hypothetical protein J0I48_05360 [Devosia sp.]|jgi:hypothetical protein|uniref:hypothetical protein n=1 Tax=unclassified Devosia TaxID=196773 RepID=UPI0009280CD4|nr:MULTISPECIES: hypothetical protein [unclassified Devosia]MBL8597973.1 hypothetical protein [Devosia sp.]MBN9345621.1 hypothetical protein [Devosia sp.]OJX50556.1 MAG: hypothetical protein BGO81_20065 [Devosia sp. 66-22]
MTIRTAKLATILMIGAALAATPVLAQAVTAGNQGPAEIPANRDAPFSLPGSLNPMPTPKVDAATTRDIFAMDPAQALDSLGTVSLDRTGDVTETEASDALRAAFETETKGHTGN